MFLAPSQNLQRMCAAILLFASALQGITPDIDLASPLLLRICASEWHQDRVRGLSTPDPSEPLPAPFPGDDEPSGERSTPPVMASSVSCRPMFVGRSCNDALDANFAEVSQGPVSLQLACRLPSFPTPTERLRVLCRLTC